MEKETITLEVPAVYATQAESFKLMAREILFEQYVRKGHQNLFGIDLFTTNLYFHYEIIVAMSVRGTVFEPMTMAIFAMDHSFVPASAVRICNVLQYLQVDNVRAANILGMHKKGEFIKPIDALDYFDRMSIKSI